MSRNQRLINLNAGKEALENLVSWDYEVHQFSDYHFRINRRLDIWPSTRKYYDTKTHRKGVYEDLEKFVKGFIHPHPTK